MARVLVMSVCSLKGGVGKTSVLLGLASAALARDVPTLVVDLDPQGDATTGLDVLAGQGKVVADVLHRARRKVVEASIAPSGWTPDSPGRIDVMAGTARSAMHDAVDAGGNPLDAHLFEAMATGLRKASGPYALALVDCPPNLGGLTRAGLSASDRALVVTEPGLFAIAAAGRALQAVDAVRRGPQSRVQPLGVVVNRFVTGRTEHTYRLEELRSLYGPLVLSPVLPERSALQQAQGAGQPLHRWPGRAAQEMSALFDQLLDRVLRSGGVRTGSRS